MVQCVGRERKVVLLVRAIILMSASWWQVPGLKLVTRAEGRKSLLAAIKFVPVRLSTEKTFPPSFSSFFFIFFLRAAERRGAQVPSSSSSSSFASWAG